MVPNDIGLAQKREIESTRNVKKVENASHARLRALFNRSRCEINTSRS